MQILMLASVTFQAFVYNYKYNYKYKPWITKQILQYIIARNKLAGKRHRNPADFKNQKELEIL